MIIPRIHFPERAQRVHHFAVADLPSTAKGDNPIRNLQPLSLREVIREDNGSGHHKRNETNTVYNSAAVQNAVFVKVTGQ